jgi:histidinol-phosphate aminotransferase
MSMVGEYPNLVVLRTFSKAHGLAGVRVGYAVSDPQIADLLNRVRQPFNVGIPALVGAEASLGDVQHTQRARQLVEDGLGQLGAELTRLGLKMHPSAGNFVLVDVSGSGQVAYERLLRQGVIVRPMGGYGLPNALRITIGTAEQNERLIAALGAVMRG